MTVTIENTAVDTTLNIAELTTGSLTGTGVFDVLLQTLRLHLDREFTSGRITGTAYATVYSQALIAFLQQATGYCVSKTKLALELQQLSEQVALLQLQQDQLTADTALKAKELDIRTYELTYIKPQELALITQQVATQQYTVQTRMPAELAGIQAETSLKAYELTDMKPSEKAQLVAQTSHVTKQELSTIQQTTNMVSQNLQIEQQTANLASQQSQIEAETAKVLYETTYVLPENVKVIKNQQDQLIAQTNKVTTDTVISIKQGHLTDAQTCQVKAETNKVNAEVTLKLPEEVELVKRNQLSVTAQIGEVNYRVSSLMPSQVASTNAQASEITYRTANLLPAQLANTTAQTAQATYTTANLLPKQVDQLTAQVAGTTAQTAQVVYTTTNLLPAQVTNTDAQTASTNAQTDLYTQKKATELAQTVSTPAANSVMGVQNALMVKQTENYERDAEQKAAKIMIDTWNVRRNQDPDTAEMLESNRLREQDIGIAVAALLAGLSA